MPYSLHSASDDCYPGTTCLINKFDIRNEEELAIIEAGITVAKSSELLQNPISDRFDGFPPHTRDFNRELGGNGCFSRIPMVQ